MKTKLSSVGLVAAGLIVPAIAAKAARLAAGSGYEAFTHRQAPKNPAHPDVEWKDAIVWTVVSGIIGGLARLAVRRWMAETSIPAEGYDMDEEIEQLGD